jgi:hypothetical protein
VKAPICLGTIAKNNFRRLHNRTGAISETLRFWFVYVFQVDENCLAARRESSRNITGSITNHKTAFERDPAFVCGSEQHTRLRFSASAVIVLRVTAHFDPVDREFTPKPIMHFFQGRTQNQPMTDFRLIRDYYEEVAGMPEPIERRLRLGIEMKVLQLPGCKAPSVTHFRDDENSVAIEKYCTTSGGA